MDFNNPITYELNYHGHLELWKGENRNRSFESDIYIQQDEEVQETLEILGIEDAEHGDWGTIEDNGIFL